MKTILPLLILLFFGCSKPSDCVKSSGTLTTKTFENLSFDRILVFIGINVVVVQGNVCKVSVSTGQNLIDDIDVSVQNGRLILKDKTTCNWIRDYGETTVTVTAPALTEIYSKTEGNISSIGTLTFPALKILALDNFDGLGGSGTGDIHLDINNQSLEIVNNSFANIEISGQTNYCNISVYEGNGKIKTQNLVSQHVQIYHRGSNGIWVHPVLSIKGNLLNVGNVFCNPKPSIVDVNSLFKGQLIF